MRVLIANHRYFISGGPERYMFSVSDALSARGHEVIPFSIHYTRNRTSRYEDYFVEPLGRRDEVYFAEQRPVPRTMARTLVRLFYAADVERAVTRLVADCQPEVAYILHYLRKLSPSLLVGLSKAGLPIVVRLSDYGMLCPQAHCLRQGKPCRLCVNGGLWPSIRHRCVQGSFAVSLLSAAATWYHRHRRFFDLVDVFVTTNDFMRDMMLAAGFPDDRLRCIPTLVDCGRFRPSLAKQEHVAYVGRLDKAKGLEVLIQAMALLSRRRPRTDMTLKIAGFGDERYKALLRRCVRDHGLQERVQFVGTLDAAGVSQLLSTARVSALPALWYENLPNALLESYACGTPVVASDLGSLRECVSDGETGLLFRTGDAGHLADQLEYCLDHPDHLSYMGRKAREEAESVYSAERHVTALESLLGGLARKS